MELKKKRVIYWHPAFYADIQIELKDEADKLTYENEHHLSKKPMQIDVLIIKNKADITRADSISAKEVTITFVSERYPRKLIRHLRTIRKYEVEKAEDGIYNVRGDVFSIQILVTKELSVKENLWLKSLTNNLKGSDNARKLIEDYQKNQENDLYKSALEAIIHANEKVFKEVNGMSIEDTFMEFVQEKFDRRLKEETEKAVGEAVEKGVVVPVEESERRAEATRLTERVSLIWKKCAKNKSLSDIAEEMVTESEEVLPIYNVIMQNPGKTFEEICELVVG